MKKFVLGFIVGVLSLVLLGLLSRVLVGRANHDAPQRAAYVTAQMELIEVSRRVEAALATHREARIDAQSITSHPRIGFTLPEAAVLEERYRFFEIPSSVHARTSGEPFPVAADLPDKYQDRPGGWVAFCCPPSVRWVDRGTLERLPKSQN